jgi:hypothetical protein
MSNPRRSSKTEALIHRLSQTSGDIDVNDVLEEVRSDEVARTSGVKVKSTLAFLICLCAMQFVVELPVFLPSAFLIDYAKQFNIENDAVIGKSV